MKFYDNIPIYVQIANDLKEQIVSERLKEDEKFPSVRECCSIYGVTSLTMQRAMQQLEMEGITYTKKGIGSFVIKGSKDILEKSMTQSHVQEFVIRMKKMGIPRNAVITLIKEAFDYE